MPFLAAIILENMAFQLNPVGNSIKMKTILLSLILCVLTGCAWAPSPRARAASRVRPVIKALQAYHHQTGDYPQNLDELRPHYVGTNVSFCDQPDDKHAWYCLFHRVDRNHYLLRLYEDAEDSGSVSAFDEQGKFLPGYECVSPSRLPMSEQDMLVCWEMLDASDDAKNPILPDKDMIAVFHNNRAIFERLLQMLIADSKLYHVDNAWPSPPDQMALGISGKRIKTYRQLLKKIGCNRGIYVNSGRQSIHFISATQGLVVSGLEKGFCYCASTPDPVVVSDTETYCRQHPQESQEVFRHIEGHWYIYFNID